ncbi:lysosomal proton-coupled steroid conjugate and bile acid symporter SLC46A3-like [Crassostrea virginica]
MKNVETNGEKSSGRFSCGGGILVISAVMFLYKTGEAMLDATTRPFLIRAVCYEVHKTIHSENKTACSDLGRFLVLEDEVQTQSGYYLIYYRLLLNIPAVVLSMFCGSYSDTHGRKLPILLPCFGSLLAAMMYMTSNMYMEYRVPMILGGSALQGMFGKSSLITMAANSTMFDLSETKNRTRNFGRLMATMFFGGTLGALMSGVFQDLLDINAAFIGIVSLFVVAISLILIFVRGDTKKTDKSDTADPDKGSSCEVFTAGHIKETIAVITKARSDNNRFKLISLIIVALMIHLCKVGEMDIKLMFLTRSPLSWPKSWFGYFLSVESAVMGLCLFLLIPLFSKKIKLTDVTIVVIGLLSMLAKVIFLGFSSTSWMVFVSIGLGAFIGMVPSTLRSLLSKTLKEDEAGKVFSILSCGETILKSLGSLIFVNIYSATAHIFRGIAFFAEAFIIVTMLVVILIMYRQLRRFQTSMDRLSVSVSVEDKGKTVSLTETQTAVDHRPASDDPVFCITVDNPK